jgi:hypothetical protein
MTISRAALAMAGLCVLAACGPNAGGNATAAGGGTTVAAAGPDQVINFSDLPHPKAGLWQTTTDNGDGKPPTTDTKCLSGKMPSVTVPKECSQFTLKRTMLGAYVMDMNCASPDFTLVSHANMTGDFQSQMSSDMTMTMTMKGQPPQTTKTHEDSKYVGPCAPGQTPDDADVNSAG